MVNFYRENDQSQTIEGGGAKRKLHPTRSVDSRSTYLSCSSSSSGNECSSDDESGEIIPIRIDIKLGKRKYCMSKNSSYCSSGGESKLTSSAERGINWNKNRNKLRNSVDKMYRREWSHSANLSSDKCCGTASEMGRTNGGGGGNNYPMTVLERPSESNCSRCSSSNSNWSNFSSMHQQQYVPTQNYFQHGGMWYREWNLYNPYTGSSVGPREMMANHSQMSSNDSPPRSTATSTITTLCGKFLGMGYL